MIPIRRLGLSALLALVLAAPALLAQISTKPWPEDGELRARSVDAQQRKLFQDERPLEFTLTSEFGPLNKERTPGKAKKFAGVLTVDGADIRVQLSSRGHLRLKTSTCDFVPIRVEFPRKALAGTVFEGQTSLKLGTHCRGDAESDQYVIREYLSYKLANLVTPLSFRARLARATYVNANSKQRSTHNALFLEHENDVARRLSGRDVKVPHLAFNAFDSNALTTMMLLEYMLGNTDYSIWTLHNVVVVTDKRRKFFPVLYDFDLSGMVNAPYAAPDPRLTLKSVTDRRYRGPCRTVEEFNAALEPFRARKAEMLAAVDAVAGLTVKHKDEMKDYLDTFFRRITTPQGVKRSFVDGCPASRGRV